MSRFLRAFDWRQHPRTTKAGVAMVAEAAQPRDHRNITERWTTRRGMGFGCATRRLTLPMRDEIDSIAARTGTYCRLI